MSNERTGVLELTLGDSYIGSAYSPQVEVTDTPTGHEVAITYMSPEGIVTERFDVADGATGPQGPAGYSPTVTITDTPTGHTVIITDAQGPHSYDVPNYAQEEQERQDAWDTLSGEVTDAITAAESATSAASTAATSATSAATSATSAAQAATTAAASANTAASSANAAATAANAAASAASTAADAATTAAGDATDAASAANTAAEAAQEAATEVAPEVAWLWSNQLTGELTGDLLTATDAYAAPPMALMVDGRSTQDGTPTPDAPVPIESVDELTLGVAGKNLLDPSLMKDQAGWNVIPVYAPVGTVLTMSTNCDARVDATGLACYFRQPNGSQGAETQVYVGHDITQTIQAQGYVEVVQRRASGTDSFANYEWQIELGSTATAYEPYIGATAPIDLGEHQLRSLPDGTRDELRLAYLRPSTREGWAVYSRTLTKLCEAKTFDGTDMRNWYVSSGTYPLYYYRWQTTGASDGSYTALNPNNCRCSACTCKAVSISNNEIGFNNTNLIMRFRYQDMTGSEGSLTDLAAYFAEHPTTFIVPMQNPVTTDLGEVELPVLPAPNATVWADPTTGLQMSYVRDTNLVIAAFEAALADLATS